ncbi:putative ribonuclease H-like domain-containing protein [Tanacetum coccineum]
MRPVGCPLTILNTLDPLGKFDGKSDKGYLLGHSTTSTQDYYVAGSSGRDKESTQEYCLLPLYPHRTRILVEDVVQAAQEKPFENTPKDKDAVEEEKRIITSQKRAAQVTSINKLNTGGPSVSAADTPYASAASTSIGANAGGSSFVYLGGQIPIDASTLPNANLPINQNMPDLEDNSDLISNDGIFSGAYDDEDVGVEADFNNMDNTIDVNPIPTLRVHKDHSKALEDESRVEAMQEELLHFKLQKVWILVDLPSGKKAIGTKWVFRNKRDERSIVVKNKARLVAQGFRHEEGIDYDEVFPPVARIETIRLFLAFESFMGFPVYQMDVKSAFLYGTIGEEDKYVADILKKFDFCSIRTATTPIKSNKPLVKDEDGVDVDVHVYRSMIGSLMYLTASRPDIIFVVCVSARFQVTPKASHLNVIKRIFSDYGGASLDKKSTTGGCQFLGRRLISWQCKKQTIVANSTTEVEYVATANCCGQFGAEAVEEGKKLFLGEDATRAIPNIGFNLVDVEGVCGFGMGEVVLSIFEELQMLGFFLQMGFTLILATFDGLEVGLLGDVIGEDDCDKDE